MSDFEIFTPVSNRNPQKSIKRNMFVFDFCNYCAWLEWGGAVREFEYNILYLKVIFISAMRIGERSCCAIFKRIDKKIVTLIDNEYS